MTRILAWFGSRTATPKRQRRRRFNRRSAAVVLGLMVALGYQPIADAHTVYSTPTVHNADGGRDCIKARAGLTHDSDYTQAQYTIYSEEIVLGWDCLRAKSRPKGHLLVTGALLYRPSGGSFGICWDDPYWWQTSASSASSVSVSERWDMYSRPCGNGDYGVNTYWKSKWNGSWSSYPPVVWSGYEYLEYEGSGGK